MTLVPSQVEKALAHIQQSPFHQSPSYQIDFDVRRTLLTLHAYHTAAESQNMGLLASLQQMTPEFQRSNTKWNRNQQIKFVENLLSGCRSTITLYSIKNSEHFTPGHCFILDGLQRLTAVSAFILGEFPIFGDVYFNQIQSPIIFNNGRLSLQIYEFDSVRKVVEFYIAMNEGITHSPDDIAIAKRYLAQLPMDNQSC